MNQYQVSESALLDARPEQVYAILSDYHQGHPAILPARYFTGVDVTRGGQGHGTELTVHMKVMGARVLYHLTVTEPEPGRILVEEDAIAGVRTTFTVDPVDGGRRARLTITTLALTSPGIKGIIEEWLNPRVTSKMYREELAQLARFLDTRQGHLGESGRPMSELSLPG